MAVLLAFFISLFCKKILQKNNVNACFFKDKGVH